MPPRKLEVLIVDDSPVTRMLLARVLSEDPYIHVMGTVNDGQAALDFLDGARPDVVLMDIHMPHMDGFEATRRIMETNPLPIVICTATADPHELAITFRSMEAGALACVEKPVAVTDPDFAGCAANLLQTIRLMSEVKVVRRWPRARTPSHAVNERLPGKMGMANGTKLVGIGASTGGPPVLQSILSSLPKDFPYPLLIVQHIARGFLPGMVEWLNQTTGLSVQIASHGTLAAPGHAYIAPDDFHLGVGSGGRMVLVRDPPESGLRPSVSYLFRSLALICGAQAIGVLLTGMGKDGALELKAMKDSGAFTIAQDRETSVVHGMPGEAIDLGAASIVLPADRIAAALVASAANRPIITAQTPP